MTTTVLDLSNYGAITAKDLSRLPPSVQRLTIGPYFCSTLSVWQIALQLPPSHAAAAHHLTHLDLDLSLVQVRSVEEVDQTVAALVSSRHPWLVKLRLCMQAPLSLLQLQPQQYSAPGDCLALSMASHLMNRPIHSCQLRVLDLQGNHMGDAGIVALIKALSCQAPLLSHLNLSNNHITTAAPCQALATWLVQDSKTTKTTSSPDCRLESLDLSHNGGMDAMGCLALIQALQRNTTLRELSLVGCPRLLNDSELVADSTTWRPSFKYTDNGSGILHQQLAHCLQRYNFSLERIDFPTLSQLSTIDNDSDADIRSSIPYYLALNIAGRRVLRQHHNNSDGDDTTTTSPLGLCLLLPYILARASTAAVVATTTNESTLPTPMGLECVDYVLRTTVPLWTEGCSI